MNNVAFLELKYGNIYGGYPNFFVISEVSLLVFEPQSQKIFIESLSLTPYADVVFVNTCSIREKAETTVRNRLKSFNKAKKQKPEMIIGVLGCMAERLKSKLLEEEKIPHTTVGRHRRVYAKDVFDYKDRKEQMRREALSKLTECDADFL